MYQAPVHSGLIQARSGKGVILNFASLNPNLRQSHVVLHLCCLLATPRSIVTPYGPPIGHLSLQEASHSGQSKEIVTSSLFGCASPFTMKVCPFGQITARFTAIFSFFSRSRETLFPIFLRKAVSLACIAATAVSGHGSEAASWPQCCHSGWFCDARRCGGFANHQFGYDQNFWNILRAFLDLFQQCPCRDLSHFF
jgi:hypothetical protein